MKIHPAAQIFPMLPTDRLEALAADIEAQGLRQPLVMYQGALLDGRNRLAACKLANVKPAFTEYDGDSPLAYVVSANLNRRQLDPSQRACVAVEIEPMFAEEARQRQRGGQGGVLLVANLPQGKSRDHAADVVGVGGSMVQQAKAIKAVDPAVFERIKAGELTVHEARQEMKRAAREEAGAIKREEEAAGTVELHGKRVKVKPGQLWLLGRHRLMCGNSQNQKDLERLTEKQPVQALITDPPYGIDYKPDWKRADGSDANWKRITGDDVLFDPAALLEIATDTTVLFGASHFSNLLPRGSWICWDKRLTEEADQMYGSPFELAWFQSTRTTKTSIMVRCLHGGVINADRQASGQAHRFHPTQKPVIVMREIIEKLTIYSDVVLDPYVGSGTTLMACEELQRTCLAMEIDPEYVATTIQRWAQGTKQIPICDGV